MDEQELRQKLEEALSEQRLMRRELLAMEARLSALERSESLPVPPSAPRPPTEAAPTAADRPAHVQRPTLPPLLQRRRSPLPVPTPISLHKTPAHKTASETETVGAPAVRPKLGEVRLVGLIMSVLASVLIFAGLVSFVLLVTAPVPRSVVSLLFSGLLLGFGFWRSQKRAGLLETGLCAAGVGCVHITLLAMHLFFGTLGAVGFLLASAAFTVLTVWLSRRLQKSLYSSIGQVGFLVAFASDALSLSSPTTMLLLVLLFVTQSLLHLRYAYSEGDGHKLFLFIVNLVSCLVLVLLFSSFGLWRGDNALFLFRFTCLVLLCYQQGLLLGCPAYTARFRSERMGRVLLFLGLVLLRLLMEPIVYTMTEVYDPLFGRFSPYILLSFALTLGMLVTVDRRHRRVSLGVVRPVLCSLAAPILLVQYILLDGFGTLAVLGLLLPALLLLYPALRRGDKFLFYIAFALQLCSVLLFVGAPLLHLGRFSLSLLLSCLLHTVFFLLLLLVFYQKSEVSRNKVPYAILLTVSFVGFVLSFVQPYCNVMLASGTLSELHDWSVSFYTNLPMVLVYFVAALSIVFLLQSGYCYPWHTRRDIRVAGALDSRERGNYLSVRIINELLLLLVLDVLYLDLPEPLHTLFVVASFAQVFVKSRELLSPDYGKWSGYYIGIKLTIYANAVLYSYVDYSGYTYLMSLLSLGLALGAILLGFRRSLPSFRLFGLYLSLLSVLKLLLFDISYENSLFRVLSLMLAGFLCFGIVWLYRRHRE